MSLSDAWNSKFTVWGKTAISLSNIPRNLGKIPTVGWLLLTTLLLDIVASQTMQTKNTPDCDKLLQELVNIHGPIQDPHSRWAIVPPMLRAQCLFLMNQFTGKALTVVDANGHCPDPKNCIRFDSNGRLDITMDEPSKSQNDNGEIVLYCKSEL